MDEQVLLGDEAVALGAVHAGLTAAYAYPGTPSTEIVEFLIRYAARHGRPLATWSANEKTAYEAALGVSFAGRRALVAMKHVGLNVAADPFINSALLDLGGGLVVVVADDPGMHSSQNEQDTRFYADFARTICFEPANAQEAYDMTREAFDLSERFRVPVVVRLVTRLAHSRGVVRVAAPREENPMRPPQNAAAWTLLPANARKLYRELLEGQQEVRALVGRHAANALSLAGCRLGVITCGIARNYYEENVADLPQAPSHLHIGTYPMPIDLIRRLVSHVEAVLVLEDGYPFVERTLRGVLQPPIEVRGKQTGALPPDGELTPDLVRTALGLPLHEGVAPPALPLPSRPPQLCAGCPHIDTFKSILKAVEGLNARVTSDIGCYTLGALPPFSAIHSCVCMGASIGMAKGAADAGLHPALAVIGDSTFLHSGITPLIDAIAANTNMTVIIADNEVVAMTGGQPTALPSSRIPPLLLGLGMDPEHLHVLETHPKQVDRNAEILRREIAYPGLSVIVTVRECIETARDRKRAPAAAAVTV
ncbi:MAG TPA: thiamine pyrophosphate-dependent enzyme [Vicinamibacterales bacterium]|nr:thiamine pyrophosphate-dependent enzyme [Vicinamibacterales bacterium]